MTAVYCGYMRIMRTTKTQELEFGNSAKMRAREMQEMEWCNGLLK
jgi:hypothetical protein